MIKYFTVALAAFSICACSSQEEQKVPTATSETQLITNAQEDSLNLILREDPSNVEAYLSRADLKYLDGRYRAAAEDADRAIRLDSSNGKAYLLKGDALFAEEAYFESQETYQLCLDQLPNYVPCLEKLAEINLIKENYTGAMEYINDALRQNQQNHYPYYLKGWIYQELGDSAKSASSYQTAIELKPDFYQGYIMLGSLYYNANHPLCLQYFNSALEVDPSSSEAMYYIAMYHQQNSNAQPALNTYKQMQKLNPNDLRPWFNSGFVHLTLTDQYDSAVYYFDRVLEQDQSYFQAYYNRGLAYLEKGEKSNAKADFQKAIALNKDYTLAIKALNSL